MTDSIRIQRINELILRELTLIFANKTKDPRFVGIQICRVEVSGDVSYGKVFFFTEQDNIAALSKLLNRKQGFFRHQLSQLTVLRHTPLLKFIYDPTLINSRKMDTLLNTLK